MQDSQSHLRCVAMTRAGERCKNTTVNCSTFCHLHRPVSEQFEVEDSGERIEQEQDDEN